MRGCYMNAWGQIGCVGGDLLEGGVERIVRGAGGVTVCSGLGRGGLSKFKSPVLSFFGPDALEEIGEGPRLVTADPNRLLVLVTVSSFMVGAGGCNGDGGITPSKHRSKVLRLGRSCG